jgi:hypothetical protein
MPLSRLADAYVPLKPVLKAALYLTDKKFEILFWPVPVRVVVIAFSFVTKMLI